MTLQTSGPISLGNVREELEAAGPISLASSAVRELAGVPDGPISLGDLYGKSDFNEGVILYQGKLFFELDTGNDPNLTIFSAFTSTSQTEYGKCDPQLVLDGSILDPDIKEQPMAVPIFNFTIAQAPGAPIGVGIWYHGGHRPTANLDLKLMQPNYLKGLRVNGTILEMEPQDPDNVSNTTLDYGIWVSRKFTGPSGSSFNLTPNAWHNVILYNPY